MQTITDAASNSSSCSVPLTTSTNDDCIGAAIPTNSSVVSKNSEEKIVMSVLENGAMLSEDQKILGTPEDKAIEEPSCVSKEESEEKEQRQDNEDSIATTEQNDNSEDDQNETVVSKEEEQEETKATKDADSKKEETDDKEEQKESSEQPETKGKPPPNPDDDDIEWLSPFSMPRVKEGDERDKDSAKKESASTDANVRDNPLKMLKKGAVAAVGGSMVGLGLVMIPLPTPFGAVVASSGLAVLGTEFDEAKDLNDRLIGGAKGHLNKARDSIVKGIEKMNQDELDADVSSSSKNNDTLNINGKLVETEVGETGNVIKTNVTETLADKSKSDGDVNEDTENSEDGSSSESPPVWLHMNPIERQRQEKLAKQKYRRDHQSSYEQAKEAFTKRTGKFLSKNLLPLIKKTESSEDAKEEQDAEIANPGTTASKNDGDSDSDSISLVEKEEALETTENGTARELETKNDEGCTIETTDNDSEGYVVVS